MILYPPITILPRFRAEGASSSRLGWRASKSYEVGIFHANRPVRLANAADVPLLVVNKEQITQGVMNEVEADVGGHQFAVAVVLDQGVQKHAGAEIVVEAEEGQVGGEGAFAELHIVEVEAACHREAVRGAKRARRH